MSHQATIGETRVMMPDLDYPLILAAAVLLGLGLVMVASASLHHHADAPFHFVNRHLIAITIGLIAALVVSRIPVAQWERSGTALYFIGLLLLVVVLLPGIGRTVNGATRWIPLGPFSSRVLSL